MLGEREVQQMKAQELGWAFADLDRIQISPDALALVAPVVARDLRLVPLKRDRLTVWVALAVPDDGVLDAVRVTTDLRVVPALCLAVALDAALERLPMA